MKPNLFQGTGTFLDTLVWISNEQELGEFILIIEHRISIPAEGSKETQTFFFF